MNWRQIAAFDVSGSPKSQPRPRAFSRGGSARVYDPATAEGWKGQVALAAREHLPDKPISGPVRLVVDFRLPRPKRLMRKNDPAGQLPHTGRLDLDNMAKAVMDAFTSIGMWADDGQVVELYVRKAYHAKDGRPGARIEIYIDRAGVFEPPSPVPGQRET